MKNNVFFSLTIIILLTGLSSCTLVKRHYMRGFYTGSKSETTAASNYIKLPVQKHSRQEQVKSLITKHALIEPPIVNGETASANEKITATTSHHLKNSAADRKSLGCDTIVLKDGGVIAARVLEIGPRGVKYRYCSGPDQEMRFFQKSVIAQITYANGTTESFDSGRNTTSPSTLPEQPKMNGFALAGFILSLAYAPALLLGFLLLWGPGYGVGLIVMLLGALAWLAALVFSVVGIIQISQDKTRYRGMVFAILGLIFSGFPLLVYLKSLLRI